jgi:hypothetical protein
MVNNIRNQGQWVSTGNPFSVNDATPQFPGQLGQRVTINSDATGPSGAPNAAKTVQYVQVDSTAPVSPYIGAVAWWSNRDTSLVTTSATNRGQIAGVFQSSAAALGNYTYIQTEGPATVKFIDAVTASPTTAGLHVIPSATNAKADCLAAGSAATYPLLGVSNSTINLGDSTAEVILSCGQQNP